MTIKAAMGLLAVLWLALAAPLAAADDAADAQEIVDEARATLERFVADPDIPWFHRNLGKAKGVLIVPRLIKGGFLIGGSGGTGVLLAQDATTGDWSPPAFYTLGSVSFGLQIGAEVAEVAMMMMTDRGKDAMLATSFKLGGDVEVAAGPVGAGAKVATADVVAFSRAKGVYGGLSLEGSVVATRDALNAAYYGRELSPIDILERREATNPGADALRAAVAKAAAAD